MSLLCLKQLLSGSTEGNVFIVNRRQDRITFAISERMSHRQRKVEVGCYEERHELAARSDLVIVATSAPEFVLTGDQLHRHRHGTNAPLCIVDMSVPRNVDPRVSEICGVSSFHSDDLAQVVGNSMAARQSTVEEVERIICSELSDFNAWWQALSVVPTIVELRTKFEAARCKQTERFLAKRRQTSQADVDRLLELLGKAIVSQLLHEPMAHLKSIGESPNLLQKREFLHMLFDLDPLGEPAGTSMVRTTEVGQLTDGTVSPAAQVADRIIRCSHNPLGAT
jgi:glutamyl-tRNA reductase